MLYLRVLAFLRGRRSPRRHRLTPEERAALRAMAGALAAFASWLRRLCDGES